MSQKSFEDPGLWTHSPGLLLHHFHLCQQSPGLPMHQIPLMLASTRLPASYSTDAGIHYSRHSGACRNPVVVLGLE